MKKLLIAAAALVSAGAPIAASAAPFVGHEVRPVAVQSHWIGHYGPGRGWGGGYRPGWGYGRYGAGWGYGRYGYGWGPGYYRGAIVPGVFGLAIGAALASERPYYAPCHYVTRTVVGPYGGVRYQNVEVCR